MHMIFLAVVLALLGTSDEQASGRHPRGRGLRPTASPLPVAGQPVRDEVPAAPVPEPVTLLLLGTDAAGLYA